MSEGQIASEGGHSLLLGWCLQRLEGLCWLAGLPAERELSFLITESFNSKVLEAYETQIGCVGKAHGNQTRRQLLHDLISSV